MLACGRFCGIQDSGAVAVAAALRHLPGLASLLLM